MEEGKKKIQSISMQMADNGGCTITYDEVNPPKKGDPHSARETNYRRESFGKEDMAKAMARMKELSGIDEKEFEEEKPEEETEEKEEGDAMEEQPSAMDDNVKLPHEE
ncbi:MAG: hypothetical protein ACHP6H_05175 [Legionellales bacterium]